MVCDLNMDRIEIPLNDKNMGYVGKLIRIFDPSSDVGHIHITDSYNRVEKSFEIKNYSKTQLVPAKV